jgi:hypothetical protein
MHQNSNHAGPVVKELSLEAKEKHRGTGLGPIPVFVRQGMKHAVPRPGGRKQLEGNRKSKEGKVGGEQDI